MRLYLLPREIIMHKGQVLSCSVDIKAFICIRVVLFTTFQPSSTRRGCTAATVMMRCVAVKDFNHLLNEFSHSELRSSFKLTERESSVAHLGVTEDLSKCSFRLSTGGGPRHLARVDGGGGPSWSPQIMRTMEQMTADKFRESSDLRDGGGGLLLIQTPSLPLLSEGECLVMKHGQSGFKLLHL